MHFGARTGIVRAFAHAASLACLTAVIALGQESTFDVASVKVVKLGSHPVFGNRGGPGTADPGRIHLCCVGMFSLLMRAYDVELDQIVGPSWIMENMGPDLYQLDATMPANTTRAQFQSMMRNLLEERFRLAVHREKRNFPGYELVISEDGPRLKESVPDPNVEVPDASLVPKRSADGSLILPPGPQMFTTLGQGVIVVQAQEKAIGDLVKPLGRLIAQSLGEDPNDFSSPKPRVVDKTGLTGTYDFTLRFACDRCDFAATNGAAAAPSNPTDSRGELPNIFGAIRKQLGLRLVKVKDVPLEMLLVDRVDKTPTAN